MHQPMKQLGLALAVMGMTTGSAQAGPFSQFFKSWFSETASKSATRAAPRAASRDARQSATMKDAGKFVAEQAGQDLIKDAARERYNGPPRQRLRSLRR